MKTNEVTKQLIKSKVMAKFSHFSGGNLYYTVILNEGNFQFTVPSSDIGTTNFYDEMKGSELNRWILKSIESNEFIKMN